MTEDLRDRLARVADDEGRPWPMTPHHLLALAQRKRRRHRAVAAASGSALVVGAAAALIAVAAVTPSGDLDRGRGGEPAEHPTPPVEETVPLDLGPLSPGAADRFLAQCARAYGGADSYRVTIARRVDGLFGPERILVADNAAAGDTIACTDGGLDGGSNGGFIAGPDTSVTLPDAQNPIVATDGSGGADSTCWRKPRTGARYWVYETRWFRVTDRIDRVEVRVGTEDEPGVWRVSRPHGGYLYAGYWLRQPFPANATIRVESRAYDDNGVPIHSATLTKTFDREMPSRVKPHGDPTLCAMP